MGVIGRRTFLLLASASLVFATRRADARADEFVVVDGWVLKGSDLAHLPSNAVARPLPEC